MLGTSFLIEIFCILKHANDTTCDITLHNDFWKSFIYFKVIELLHINTDAHASAVSVIFYYYMPQNKQSHRHSLCTHDVTRCIICISNKVRYLDKEHSYKNFTKDVIL